MKVIILAAGRGERLLPLTKDIPKSLLSIGKETIIGRLIRQLRGYSFDDISIVAGYKKERIYNEIKKIGGKGISIIENPRYEEDINIYSLYLALSQRLSPFIVIEADVIFEDACVKYILEHAIKDESIWFTYGYFQDWQYGGILKSDDRGNVLDIKIVKKFQSEYSSYKKLIGVMKVGKNEIAHYRKLMFIAHQDNIRQYYLMPWIKHLNALPCRECDLGGYKAASFNSVVEYENAQKLFRWDGHSLEFYR